MPARLPRKPTGADADHQPANQMKTDSDVTMCQEAFSRVSLDTTAVF